MLDVYATEVLGRVGLCRVSQYSRRRGQDGVSLFMMRGERARGSALVGQGSGHSHLVVVFMVTAIWSHGV
jgi:hypothetical protein